MKKLVNLKNIIFIIAVFIILFSFVFFLFYKKEIKIKTFDNESYKFIYDDNWKVSSSNKDSITLKNKKNAMLNINIIDLDNESQYLSIDELIDNVTSDIESQNKDYKLVSKKDTKVTENNYNGYKYLYEYNDSEVMLVITKYSNKILIFTFEASNKNFDILLDSVENIIYHFTFKSETYALSNQINVDTKKISYSTNDNLNKEIDKLDSYDIATNHCLINYSLPNIFRRFILDTTSGYFIYDSDLGNMTLSVNIYNQNIYEYLDENASSGTIYSNYASLKDSPDKYQNISTNLSEITKNNFKGYIYQVKYTEISEKYLSKEEIKTNYEVYHMVFMLDKNHILIMQLRGENIKIPQKLIDNIEINSFKHYSSNINHIIENNQFAMDMQQYQDYTNEHIDNVSVIVPEQYQELDLGYNMYQYRFLGLNKDNNNGAFQYEIRYNLSVSSDNDANIKSVNLIYSAYNNYENFEPMQYQRDITINGKTFSLYEGGYTKRDTLYGSKNRRDTYHVNIKALIYKLETNGSLVIAIFGNDAEIDENMLSELTNFDVTSK